ncbi:hypothetical protein [Neisseria sicca]|nr:hypothetical protein [Neisseria sicca]
MKGQIFRRPFYVYKPYLEIVFDEVGKYLITVYENASNPVSGIDLM